MMCQNEEPLTQTQQQEQPCSNTTDYAETLHDMLDMLDELHSIASEGNICDKASMSERELMSLLRDVIYTAQETMAEVQSQRKTQKPILRIVEKFEKVG